MSARDEQLGVGVYRDDVSLDAIEAAQNAVLEKARTLGWELHARSSDEKLSDAEVYFINAVSVLEGYKLKPWATPSERGKK